MARTGYTGLYAGRRILPIKPVTVHTPNNKGSITNAASMPPYYYHVRLLYKAK